MVSHATHPKDVAPGPAKPAHTQTDANGWGPDGGTWAHADWTARVRPTASSAITAYSVRDVWLVEVTAPLTQIAADLVHTIEWALAECPRGVVVELQGEPYETVPDKLGVLASAGRHVWAWPAAPVAVVSKDPQTSVRLQRLAHGKNLLRCSSMLEGWAQIMTAQPALTAKFGVASNALAVKDARVFVARACLDWHLGARRPAAVAVVSELAANAVSHVGSSDLEVNVALFCGRLRIAVRDRSPNAPREPTPGPADHARPRPRLIGSLADLTGTLPTREGGALAWAILGPRDAWSPAQRGRSHVPPLDSAAPSQT